MIIKASERGGGKQLGLHLMNVQDNEHVSVHEIRGFVSDDVVGAMKEAYAVSKGTKAKNFLFSVSFNPPEDQQVDISTFEDAINRVEQRNGLENHPRVIVWHEKAARRHGHCVWSRIDAETMTAKNLSHYKRKCMDVSREMYLEHGWQMPKGMMSEQARDPRNFTLEEWQQSKRAGFHARDLKQTIQECWAVSDSRAAFSSALEERGMKLARGDRRGHVVVTHEGEVFSVARYAGQKAKDVRARLGDEQDLNSVDDTKAQFIKELTPRFQHYLKQQDAKEAAAKAQTEKHREQMTALHRRERTRLDQQQQQRWEQETRERSQRLNKGLQGFLDRVTGTHAKTKRQNEKEAYAALQRDRDQQQRLVTAQLGERQKLQSQIRRQRAEAVKERLAIHKKLDDMRKGRLQPDRPKVKPKPAPAKTKQTKPTFNRTAQPQAPPAKQPAPQQKPLLPKERLDHVRREYLKAKLEEKKAAPAKLQQARPKSPGDKLSALRRKKSTGLQRPITKSKGPKLER